MTVGGEISDELVHQVETDFFVSLLATAKAKLDANFHVIAEELYGMIAFGCEVVGINSGRDLEFLELGPRLFGIFAAFGFVVKKFAVIDNAANGRGGSGSDFDEIEAPGTSKSQGVVERHDAELLFGIADNADFSGPDFAIAPMERFARTK